MKLSHESESFGNNGTSVALEAPEGVHAHIYSRNKNSLPTSRWWMAVVVIAAIWVSFFAATLSNGFTPEINDVSVEWLAMGLLHLPYMMILVFLAFGLVERIGFYFKGRSPAQPGRLPTGLPRVCIQLPMFNEQAVAGRSIEAAAAQQWPSDRLTIQVLDDSTDPLIRATVEEICRRVQQQTGVTVHFIHRKDRQGYKAGALEAGRRQSEAEFIAISMPISSRRPTISCARSRISTMRKAYRLPIWRSSKHSGAT